MTLKQITPPEKPQIRDISKSRKRRTSQQEDTNQAGRRIGPYTPGDDIMIKCTTLGGNPTPKLTWWVDHKPAEH